MRFISDGPAIPDELLLARDEGRVVFFCGAGVSRARAKLSDFFGLAGTVLDDLRVPSDHRARKLLAEALSIEGRTGLAGLISADRIFALLARDFAVRDVERAVAKALKPSRKVDISAHRVIVDLASTPDQGLKLVTTNFDRLFETCRPKVATWCGPRLPDPSQPNEMTGLVYLHGRVTKNYSGAENQGFILSTGEYGRAYLSEAWATRFVRSVIDRYVVVFVGYSADDPPIQYLLEALSVQGPHPHGIYAFQEGVSNEATGKWIHKGVRAIPYAPAPGHTPLWQTLEAWAERARNPSSWYSSVIQLAKNGPSALEPHQRGQIAHIVSTADGARRFANSDPPPPADWLCTFDARQRYANPSSPWEHFDKGTKVDPFPLFCIDSDEVPERDRESSAQERKVPSGAWDALVANRRDLVDAPEEHCSTVHGRASLVPNVLPARLRHIGDWIVHVSHQPAAPWWAAKKGGVHPVIQRRITSQLQRKSEGSSSPHPVVRRAWQYLIETWSDVRDPESRDWYEVKAKIAADGWDASTIRRFCAHFQPYLLARPSWLGEPLPPKLHDDIRLSEIALLEVKYPEAYDQEKVPPEILSLVLRRFRRNLLTAIELEDEIGQGSTRICPINREDNPEIDTYERTHRLSGVMIYFAELFQELKAHNLQEAQTEFHAWGSPEEGPFARLKVWAASDPEIASETEFSAALHCLSDESFWESSFQRDLLLAISGRWPQLSHSARKIIEDRLLADNRALEWVAPNEINERKAWSALLRIEWLRKHGCNFSSTVSKREKKLRRAAPEFRSEFADNAVTSVEGRGGLIRTDTTYDMLLATDLAHTLDRAKALQGRTEDFLVEADPFKGLVAARPARALSALTRSTKNGLIAGWAWQAFLGSEARKSDSPRMDRVVVRRLLAMPNSDISEFARAASSWLKVIAERLSRHSQADFDLIVAKLADVIAEYPGKSGSGILRGAHEPDWVTEAINSPAGHLAESLMEDPRKDNLKARQGFNESWLALAENLLALPDDSGRYALIIFCFNLNWFYHIDPKWTAKHLIGTLETESDSTVDAFWNGFFWGAQVPNRELYVVLKPHLIRFAGEGIFARRGYGDVLAGIVLAGWGTTVTKKRLVSNAEMHELLLRSDESFRSKILRQLKIWIGQADDAAGWKKLAPKFLQDVWPKQKFIRSSRMSSNLVEVLFEDAGSFPQLVGPILPLLEPVEEGDFTIMPSIRSEVREPDIVTKYPESVLSVLYAVLSEDVSEWPYEAEKVLDKIGESDELLKNDPRYIELNRRWNSR